MLFFESRRHVRGRKAKGGNAVASSATRAGRKQANSVVSRSLIIQLSDRALGRFKSRERNHRQLTLPPVSASNLGHGT
jgi:hypothetical protein